MNKKPYEDLRDFIDRVEALGVLRRIDGADPALEIPQERPMVLQQHLERSG